MSTTNIPIIDYHQHSSPKKDYYQEVDAHIQSYLKDIECHPEAERITKLIIELIKQIDFSPLSAEGEISYFTRKDADLLNPLFAELDKAVKTTPKNWQNLLDNFKVFNKYDKSEQEKIIEKIDKIIGFSILKRVEDCFKNYQGPLRDYDKTAPNLHNKEDYEIQRRMEIIKVVRDSNKYVWIWKNIFMAMKDNPKVHRHYGPGPYGDEVDDQVDSFSTRIERTVQSMDRVFDLFSFGNRK